MSSRDRDLARRFLSAEAQVRRDRYRPKEKRDWLTTHCPHCEYKIQYVPTEHWEGRLRCPECREFFDVKEEKNDEKRLKTLLDYFPVEHEAS